MSSLDRPLLLSRMETACRQTRRHLGLIERQIARRAERLAITERAKKRSHSRGTSTWTPADERLFLEHVDRLIFDRRCEIDAFARKLAQQERAIDDRRKGLP